MRGLHRPLPDGRNQPATVKRFCGDCGSYRAPEIRARVVARLGVLAVVVLFALAANASAADTAPFLPAPPPTAKIVKVLAPPDFLDRGVIESFEVDARTGVALDAYADPEELAARTAEQRYDVLILRGPALARRLTARGLARLDRKRLPNARLMPPAIAVRYATYDREGAYSVPFGWSAFGLLYDANKAAPVSWAQALGLTKDRAPDCPLVWPNAREESFFAVWRLMGVDAARARLADVKAAALTLEKVRGGFLAFAAPDEVGAFAKGAACIGAGAAGEAAAAIARGGDSPPNVRFAYPREGAPLALYALAIPADAPSPDAAYRLIDTLLAPENARRDAAAAGLNDAQTLADADIWKRLTPEPVLDPAVANAMQSEWRRLIAAK
jgi:putrescine transport system substrate-binding protein